MPHRDKSQIFRNGPQPQGCCPWIHLAKCADSSADGDIFVSFLSYDKKNRLSLAKVEATWAGWLKKKKKKKEGRGQKTKQCQKLRGYIVSYQHTQF